MQSVVVSLKFYLISVFLSPNYQAWGNSQVHQSSINISQFPLGSHLQRGRDHRHMSISLTAQLTTESAPFPPGDQKQVTYLLSSAFLLEILI